MNTITKAIVLAQKELTNPKVDGRNPVFKSEYASLEAHLAVLRPVLAKHGLAIMQHVVDLNGQLNLNTTLTHESGESQTLQMPLILSKNDMQGLGSAITYARRYALASAFNLGSDDDDANLTVQQTTQASKVPTKPAAQPVKQTKTVEKEVPKNEAPISLAQQKELFSLAEKYGIKPTTIQDILKQKYGVEKSADIKVWQFTEIKGELVPK